VSALLSSDSAFSSLAVPSSSLEAFRDAKSAFRSLGGAGASSASKSVVDAAGLAAVFAAGFDFAVVVGFVCFAAVAVFVAAAELDAWCFFAVEVAARLGAGASAGGVGERCRLREETWGGMV